MTSTATETITFNVGGHLYEVSRSTLDVYPESLLSQTASQQWNVMGPGKAIFIDRDGARFSFILDFLRDGHIFLPITITKSSMISELAYYGFEDVDESCIDDSMARGIQARHGMEMCSKFVSHLEDEGKYALITKSLIEEYFKFWKGKGHVSITVPFVMDMGSSTEIKTGCNLHLSKIGLILESIELSSVNQSSYSFIAKLVPLESS